MKKVKPGEKDVIEFLNAYPNILPSQAEKAFMVARVRREIRKSQETKSMSSMDILFAFLLLLAIPVLTFFNAVLVDLSAEQILSWFHQYPFWQLILFCSGIAGLLSTSLLLTLIPLNKGGNN